MTDLRDHAQKIERIAQALTAEGIGRDVAVSTALMRFPPHHESGHRIKHELAAIKTKDDGLRPAIHTYAPAKPALDPAASALDPISELADCEPVHFTLMVVADRNQRTEMVSCTASQCGASADSLIYAGEIGKQEANTAVRFLRAQKPMEIIIGATARFGTLHRFDVTTRGPGTYYVMEFKLADDRKLATAMTITMPGGRVAVDFPLPQQPDAGMLQCEPTYIVIAAQNKAFYTLEFKATATSPAGDKFSGEHHNWGLVEEFIELASAYKATKALASLTAGVHTRFGYVTGHSVTKTGPDLWRWSLDFTYGAASTDQPQQPRLVSLKRAAALWHLLEQIEALDVRDFEDPTEYMKAVDHRAQKRDQYLSGGHLIVVSDQTREMTAEESAEGAQPDAADEARAALFSALDREDSALTTTELVKALASERDTLIDREAQMRAAVLGAIGPVSTGSTLDLVRDLAKTYKTARADLASESEAHAAVLSAVGTPDVLGVAQHMEQALCILHGGGKSTIFMLAQKLASVLSAERADNVALQEENRQLKATLDAIRSAVR